MCTYVQDINFLVLQSGITLDKVDLIQLETFRSKPHGINAGLFNYLRTLYISGVWCDNYKSLVNV